MSLEQLRAERDRINEAIAVLMGEAPAEDKKRKPNKNKGKPTVWGDFSKKIQAEHKEQIAQYKAAHPGEKSAHLAYVTQYRKDNEALYEAFKATWKEAHPDLASETESVKAEDAKPKRVISEEQKAKMKAGREKKKAEKDAAKAEKAVEAVVEPVVAPVVEPVVAPVVEPVPVAKPKKVKVKA